MGGVEWSKKEKSVSGISHRPSEGRKEVAREVLPPWEKVHAPRSRGGRAFNGFRDQWRRNKYNSKFREVRWIKVGDKNGNHPKSLISNPINEGPSSFNNLEKLISLEGTKEAVNEKVQHMNGKDDLTKQTINKDVETMESLAENEEVNNQKQLIIHPGPFLFEKSTVWPKLHGGKGSNGDLEDYQIEEELGIDNSSEQSSDTNLESTMKNLAEILDHEDKENRELSKCIPLASYAPEDWMPEAFWQDREDILCLEYGGEEQQKISAWVLSRMKSLKRILGISCDGFEEQFMDLLKSMEARRGSIRREEGKKQSKSARKGMRELRNLQCSISYDKGSMLEEHKMKNLFLE